MTAADDALREAMSRLLGGRPLRTDGALTKKNLYLEAEVSRATMNRSIDVMKEWDVQVARALGEDPDAKKPVTEESKLRRKLREANTTIRELRETIDGAASLIALLSEENRYLRDREAKRPDARLSDLEEFRAREPR